MVGVRKRGEEIRQFILESVENHRFDLAKVVAEAFGISRQAVNRHIHQLIEQSLIEVSGSPRSLRYSLKSLFSWEQAYPLDGKLEEDRVWRTDIAPLLGDLPKNVIDISHYGFTEILNNAIDHSGGTSVSISLDRTITAFEIAMLDNGEGIFKKIKNALNLLDERESVLELAKGKLTTDPSNHTGEGIFFTSRVFDDFMILSGDVAFSHYFGDDEDWIMKSKTTNILGTAVFMQLKNNTQKTLKSVFDQFTSGDDFAFSKTVVPVELAQYGNEALMSRSQAKRVLTRIEKFKTVIFDFKGVETVGQAFADEIFRVFALQHPSIELIPVNANPDVQAMISRALAAR
jgi:anti-sigma regulatory factor (Ser/Thr protein kinase)